MTHGLVVLLALLAAICMAIGIVVRQRATMDVPHEHGVSTTMITTLLRKRLWWIGTGVAVAGFAFQALALTKGSLLVVQPLLVSSLLFALPLSARLADRKVTTAEWLWALLLTLGLAAFVLLARPRPGNYDHHPLAWAVLAVVLVPLVAVCVFVGQRVTGRPRAILIAASVGILFGVVAVLTKLITHTVATDGVVAMLRLPALYLVIVVGVVATLLQQSAFHAGALQWSVPTMLVLEPAAAVLLGSLIFEEHITATGMRAVAFVLAIVVMAAATIALGRDEGAYEDRLEAEFAKRRAG